MGSNDKLDFEAQPQHPIELGRFLISRYQVTHRVVGPVLQTMRISWFMVGCLTKCSPLSHRYIEWNEAVAYCEWLTTQLRNWDKTPEPLATLLRKGDERGVLWQITLPTEAQWERAARGADGRIYPWGNEFDAEKCNVWETRIGRPTAVGFFPNGVSPEDCLDMSGNLWDWTRTKWGHDYPYDAQDGREDLGSGGARVVRGGAFYYDFHSARCANRRSFDYAGYNVGLRVCASPFASVI